jgi:two-component system sensor histidine kinase YesM
MLHPQGGFTIRNLKLKSKLILLLILTIMIPFIIVNIVVLKLNERKINSQTEAIAITSVNQEFDDLNNLLTKYIQIINGYCYNNSLIDVLGERYPDGLSGLDAYNRIDRSIINDILAVNFHVYIRIFYFNDTFPSDYQTFFHFTDEIKNDENIRLAMEQTNEIIWGDNNNQIILTKSINDISGKSLGVINISLSKEDLFISMNKYKAKDRLIVISDSDGKVIKSNSPELSESSLKSNKNMLLDYKDDAKYKMFVRVLNVNNVMPKWQIINIIPKNSLVAEGEKIQNIGFLIYFLCLVCSCIIFLMLLNRILGRISRLIIKIKDAGEGRFQTMDEVGPKDEIGILIKRFNTMSINLDQLIYENYETKLQLNEISLKKREAELNALQSQIQPHFLFNTLESIRMKLQRNNSEDAGKMIVNLSKILRRSLDWRKELATLGEEIEFVKHYLEIQKFRFREKLNYQIHIPRNLLTHSILKFIVQPLVENSIQHGFENKIEGGMITIAATESSEELIILVMDDGVGMNEEKLEAVRALIYNQNNSQDGKNIGLKNIHERLLLHFGVNCGLKVFSEVNKGTEVTITIKRMNANV